MPFPFQLPGNNGRNPTLLPNFYRPFSRFGQLELIPSASLEADVASQVGAATPASGSVALAGAVASGDVLSLSVANGVLGKAPVVVTYTLTSSDTIDTAAANLAAAFNATPSLLQYGFWANSTGDGTITVYQRGPVGNFTTLAFSSTGSETATVTQPTGGKGMIVPLTNFTFSNNGDYQDFWYGLPYEVNYHQLDAMVTQGMSIS
jgi:phage tail sheath gpL-like